MGYFRNLLFFAAIAFVTVACGGGNSAVTTNNSTGNGTGGTGSTAGGTTGTVTLKWAAPSTYANNTAASLSEITGYRLYYGPSATNTPNYVNITNGSTMQYTITLPSGTYYFRISAIDTNGYEGLKSSALQKSL